jgi:hypothetical protein
MRGTIDYSPYELAAMARINVYDTMQALIKLQVRGRVVLLCEGQLPRKRRYRKILRHRVSGPEKLQLISSDSKPESYKLPPSTEWTLHSENGLGSISTTGK